MSHVTHVNESRHTRQKVMSHARNEACHTCKHLLAHIRMSHVTRFPFTSTNILLDYGAVMKCVISHTRMSRVTFVNTYEPDFYSTASTFYTTMM